MIYRLLKGKKEFRIKFPPCHCTALFNSCYSFPCGREEMPGTFCETSTSREVPPDAWATIVIWTLYEACIKQWLQFEKVKNLEFISHLATAQLCTIAAPVFRVGERKCRAPFVRPLHLERFHQTPGLQLLYKPSMRLVLKQWLQFEKVKNLEFISHLATAQLCTIAAPVFRVGERKCWAPFVKPLHLERFHQTPGLQLLCEFLLQPVLSKWMHLWNVMNSDLRSHLATAQLCTIAAPVFRVGKRKCRAPFVRSLRLERFHQTPGPQSFIGINPWEGRPNDLNIKCDWLKKVCNLEWGHIVALYSICYHFSYKVFWNIWRVEKRYMAWS